MADASAVNWFRDATAKKQKKFTMYVANLKSCSYACIQLLHYCKSMPQISDCLTILLSQY